MDCALSGTVTENNPSLQSCSAISNCNESSSQETPSVSGEGANNQKVYKCSQCDSTFFRYPHLQDHLNRHSGDRKYHCKEKKCTKAYFAWKHLRNHLIASHKLDNVKKSQYMKTESDETGGKRHTCSYEGCLAAYDRRWKLLSHMCKHTGKKLHPCTENDCKKAYTTIGHLRRHIAKFHSPNNSLVVEEYLCPEFGCEEAYRTMENVRRHYLIHHNKDRPKGPPFICTSCDRNFATLERFGHHKCVSVKCEKCNITFTSLVERRNHVKKMHQYSYTCSDKDCSKVFPQFSLLREHRKAEHKQYHCSVCNKKISSKYVKNHQQRHLFPERQKLFPCPYIECSRYYTRKGNLDQHIRSSHEDIKFHCTIPGCEKRLVTKQKLQEHLKLHDPLREPRQRKQIARRQRKDAGQPKRSMAIKLSGVSASYREEQIILNSGINNVINSQLPSAFNEMCVRSLEVSDDWRAMSETEEWSELSDLSDELNESDASDESYFCMVDNESALLPSRYSNILGDMAGALDDTTELCCNDSNQVQNTPLDIVKKHKSLGERESAIENQE